MSFFAPNAATGQDGLLATKKLTLRAAARRFFLGKAAGRLHKMPEGFNSDIA